MKILVGIFLATVAMFVFGAAFWMNPLTTSFFMQSIDDRMTGEKLKELFPSTGTYVVPSMANEPDVLTALHEAGPIATVHIRHQGGPAMDPMMMITGFAHELVSVGFGAVLLLTLGGTLRTYVKRVGFLVSLGALIAWYSPLSQPIWWLYPWPVPMLDAVYTVGAWTVAGLVLAAFVRPRSRVA